MFEKQYTQRVGKPTTDDEVQGHLLFTLGMLAGLGGMLLFVFSTPASLMRELGIVFAAGGLSLIVAGPVIRLPLQRAATTLVVAGLIACGAAVVWFTMVYPQAWRLATGQESVIALYGAGMILMGVGGVFVPLLSPTTRGGDRAVGTEPKRTDPATDPGAGQAAEEARQDADRAHRAEEKRLRAALAGAEGEQADLAAELAALRASRSGFEIHEDDSGTWCWRLIHEDGDVLAMEGQDHARRQDAQDAVSRVRSEALGATLVHREPDETPTSEEDIKPVPTAATADADEASSQAAFELYKGEAGNWRWHLQHQNGRVLADSGESFDSKANARRAILSVQETAGPADALTFDPTGFQVYQDRAGEYRWRLIHRNGNILADGGQGYASRSNADRAVRRLRDDPGSLDLEVYEDEGDAYRWRMTAQNGEIVADSGQGYTRKADAQESADRIGKHAANADVLDIGLAAFEVYNDAPEVSQWRLRHRNGNILAKGTEGGYTSDRGAREGILSVKRHVPGAEIEEA